TFSQIGTPLVAAEVDSQAFRTVLAGQLDPRGLKQRDLKLAGADLQRRDAASGVDDPLPRHVVLVEPDAVQYGPHLPRRARRARHRGDLAVRHDLALGHGPDDVENALAEASHA